MKNIQFLTVLILFHSFVFSQSSLLFKVGMKSGQFVPTVHDTIAPRDTVIKLDNESSILGFFDNGNNFNTTLFYYENPFTSVQKFKFAFDIAIATDTFTPDLTATLFIARSFGNFPAVFNNILAVIKIRLCDFDDHSYILQTEFISAPTFSRYKVFVQNPISSVPRRIIIRRTNTSFSNEIVNELIPVGSNIN